MSRKLIPNPTTGKLDYIDDTSVSASTFIGLTDTPANYTGAGSDFVKVNAAANALEFVDISSINVGDFNDDGTYALIAHTHTTGDINDFSIVSPSNNQLLVYNSTTGVWENTQSLTLFNLNVTNNTTINTSINGVLKASSGLISGSATTTDLTEGTNLYYTDERVDDRVASLLVAGEGIDLTYDDVSNTLTISGEDASDTNKGIASFNATDFSVSSGSVSLAEERIQDIVGAMVSGNTETLISVTYDDSDGTLDFVVDNDLSNYSNANSNFFDTAGTGLSSTGSTVNLNASFNDLTNVIYTNQNGAVIVDNGTNLVRLDAPALDGNFQLEVQKSGSTYTFSWGNAVPLAPSLSSVLTQGRTSSGNNPQLTTTDRLEFRDTEIYIYSEADANLSIVADGQIRIDAGTQFLADEGMTINLPSVSAYNVGFRVDASSVGYPGIRFLRTATSAGDIVFGTTSADYHVFGSLGSTKVGDVTHTDGTRSMTFDASAGELAVTDGVNTLRMDAVNGRFEIGANNGASGSFTSADAKTITVTGGIITSIV